ncbi:MAG: serine/threonine protein kinase [Solirubrobacteraceae bacterium]|nr:serine/threonine protein kinase [Solirubrobacteraceae bacterium]
MTTLVGTLLSGRYRLDAEIGAGGMSTVYRAFDTLLERQVAIKLMHRETARDGDQIERFRREARHVAQLNHPHVVQVIDAGEDGDRPYIVLEYVEGETLKQRIRRMGRLPVTEAIAYAIEIARALSAAHERGIVHRDVKPQNVLVDTEGTAKVTDFGIARGLADEGLTADGRVLGTTDYVSPEQALGHPVTGQSDVYSLGIVLYEMLTGEVPFRGENQIAVAMKHVREELPDVRLRRPEVSASLGAVLDRATEKDLARRYPDAASFAADLEDVLAVESSRSGEVAGEATTVIRSLPAPTRSRVPLRARAPRILVVVALVLAVAGVAAALWLARDRTERGVRVPDVTPSVPNTEVVPLKTKAASDFDPEGGDGEHPGEAIAAIDDDPKSAWSTERYEGGQLNKSGVGLYVDASPGVVATRLELRTTTPGWSGEVYAAEDGPPDALDGWTKVATLSDVKRSQQVPLDTAGRKFRYYLVWITQLPPDSENATISDLALLSEK